MIPADMVGLWETAMSRARREGLELNPNVHEAVHRGQLLEVLLAEYLASPEHPSS